MPGRALRRALNIDDLGRLARRRLPRGVHAYIEGGAEDQLALARIRAAWDAIGFEPRILVDAASRTQAVTLFGRRQPSPLVVAPTAMAGLVWYRGEVALAQAAAAADIPFCVSTQSVTSVEDIAAGAPGARLWFQLYVLRDRALTHTIVDRARDAGAEALVLTVDTQASPNREYNARNGFGMPLRPTPRNVLDVFGHPGWLCAVLLRHLVAHRAMPTYAHYPAAFGHSLLQASAAQGLKLADDLDWADVAALRRAWTGPLILKGVLRVADAERAAAAGVDGIVVSNHGGRNLDAGRPVPEVLPRIADAVGHRMTVLADSGMRRGSDVVKALALGAHAVMLGRAPLYGTAAGGSPGAARALALLVEEIDRTQAFIGAPDLAAIGRDAVGLAG